MTVNQTSKTDILADCDARAAYIRSLVTAAGAAGVVLGNSGGKDCALVAALCRRADVYTLGVMLPCSGRRNYGEDLEHARLLSERFGFENILIDLQPARDAVVAASAAAGVPVEGDALINTAPRLRMTALYAVGRARNLLVAGTGNRSERYMGYFTKWGDGAFDFNPVSDLTVTEVFAYLRALDAPGCIVDKAPSAALYEGQTDELDMGVSYAAIDRYILTGEADARDKAIIDKAHRASRHKRGKMQVFKETE